MFLLFIIIVDFVAMETPKPADIVNENNIYII